VSFNYFLVRPMGRRPRWIRGLQWFLFLLWLAFSYWIFAGSGFRYLHQYFAVFHGVFAGEVTLRAGILPNWGLVTLALGVLTLWLQILWARCGVEIRDTGAGWAWTGRRGPAHPGRAVLTPGGVWLSENGRWFLISKGYVDEEGRDWLLSSGATRLPVFHPLSLASPLTLLLLVLVGGAYLLQRPVREHGRIRTAVYRALEEDSPMLQAMAVRYPEFKPWVRYLSTLVSCDKAACLKSQIADRLEMTCIGPSFGGDTGTLFGLLLLTRQGALALKVLNPTPKQAFELALRVRRPAEARAILAASPPAFREAGSRSELLLLEEGRYDEAWRQGKAKAPDDTLNGVKQSAVVAHMSGHREEARALALRLLAPEHLRQSRLEGDAPPGGLGALQRAVRDVKHKSSTALGHAVLGDLESAGRDWEEAEWLATAAGTPGALDRERIFMEFVAPAGRWDHRAGGAAAARAEIAGPPG
jgi:hypothetical protein